MNINTSTLLNMLSPKLDTTLTAKIETLSKDGKVDLSSLLKDKSIGTIINGLFKDIISGLKTKATVANLLENSKPMFDFKNLSNDVKDLLKQIQSDPKLQKQAAVLKEFLVDIKKLDNQVLKANISNSGVFLESKILDSTKPQVNILKDIATNIKDVLKQIQSNPKLQEQVKVLKEFLSDVTKLETKGVKADILNSKEFIQLKSLKTTQNMLQELKNTTQPQKQTTVLKEFVSNIKIVNQNILKANIVPNIIINNQNTVTQTTEFKNDIKATIMQIKEQIESGKVDTTTTKIDGAKIDKMLSQIDFYQLLSHTTMANHTYLPFDWENIEDGSISFNSNEKEDFSCLINLTLKEQGELKVMLLLDNKNNINININVKEKDFKETIQNNLQHLRQGITNIGLSLQSLNIFDIQDEKNKTYEEKAYTSNIRLDLGVDIKA